MNANCFVDLLIPRLLIQYISEQLGQAWTRRSLRGISFSAAVGKQGFSFSTNPSLPKTTPRMKV
jgi:hypothetical protein